MTNPTKQWAMPRMLAFALLTVVLIAAAYFTQSQDPGSLVAVTLYKAHLMALGGWGGYWLDRALFPYDRPHKHLLPDAWISAHTGADATLADELEDLELQVVGPTAIGLSMMRRAVVVAACLICVGLGA